MRIFLFLDSLPKGLVWTFAVFIVFFFGVQLFRVRPRKKREEKRMPPSSAQELSLLLRRARYSPWARRSLRHRVARILVTIRTEREHVSPERVWQELRDGLWPKENALSRFLRGEDSRGFLEDLKQALEELQRYAQGGTI